MDTERITVDEWECKAGMTVQVNLDGAWVASFYGPHDGAVDGTFPTAEQAKANVQVFVDALRAREEA